jgi:hypothetical protein
MQCQKCKTEMQKNGILIAGNTKYEKWRCTKCWSEKSVALGVIGQQ